MIMTTQIHQELMKSSRLQLLKKKWWLNITTQILTTILISSLFLVRIHKSTTPILVVIMCTNTIMFMINLLWAGCIISSTSNKTQATTNSDLLTIRTMKTISGKVLKNVMFMNKRRLLTRIKHFKLPFPHSNRQLKPHILIIIPSGLTKTKSIIINLSPLLNQSVNHKTITLVIMVSSSLKYLALIRNIESKIKCLLNT